MNAGQREGEGRHKIVPANGYQGARGPPSELGRADTVREGLLLEDVIIQLLVTFRPGHVCVCGSHETEGSIVHKPSGGLKLPAVFTYLGEKFSISNNRASRGVGTCYPRASH